MYKDMSISYRKDIEKRLGIERDLYYKTGKVSESSFTFSLHIEERLCNLYIPKTIILPGDGKFRFKHYKSRI